MYDNFELKKKYITVEGKKKLYLQLTLLKPFIRDKTVIPVNTVGGYISPSSKICKNAELWVAPDIIVDNLSVDASYAKIDINSNVKNIQISSSTNLYIKGSKVENLVISDTYTVNPTIGDVEILNSRVYDVKIKNIQECSSVAMQSCDIKNSVISDIDGDLNLISTTLSYVNIINLLSTKRQHKNIDFIRCFICESTLRNIQGASIKFNASDIIKSTINDCKELCVLDHVDMNEVKILHSDVVEIEESVLDDLNIEYCSETGIAYCELHDGCEIKYGCSLKNVNFDTCKIYHSQIASLDITLLRDREDDFVTSFFLCKFVNAEIHETVSPPNRKNCRSIGDLCLRNVFLQTGDLTKSNPQKITLAHFEYCNYEKPFDFSCPMLKMCLATVKSNGKPPVITFPITQTDAYIVGYDESKVLYDMIMEAESNAVETGKVS